MNGINAYIRLRGEDLPLEFQSANHSPEEWTAEDLFSFFTLNSWMFRENYRSELMALLARSTVELQEWKEIYPSHRGANLPADEYYESLRSLKLGCLHKAELSFFQALPEQAARGGSNLWVVANVSGSKPLCPTTLISVFPCRAQCITPSSNNNAIFYSYSSSCVYDIACLLRIVIFSFEYNIICLVIFSQI